MLIMLLTHLEQPRKYLWLDDFDFKKHSNRQKLLMIIRHFAAQAKVMNKRNDERI